LIGGKEGQQAPVESEQNRQNLDSKQQMNYCSNESQSFVEVIFKFFQWKNVNFNLGVGF
jgi:hypothetical protein